MSGFGQEPRVGGVDPIDIGVDFTSIGAQDGGQGDGCGIAAAASQGGDIEFVVDSLEARRDDDLASVKVLADPIRRDRFDASFGIRAIGTDSHLGTGQRDRLVAEAMNRHGHERDTDLFAGAQEHVHFACRGLFVQFPCQIDQVVCLMAHGTDDDDHLIAFLLGADRFARRGLNLFWGSDARPTELLDNQSHWLFHESENP